MSESGGGLSSSLIAYVVFKITSKSFTLQCDRVSGKVSNAGACSLFLL